MTLKNLFGAVLSLVPPQNFPFSTEGFLPDSHREAGDCFQCGIQRLVVRWGKRVPSTVPNSKFSSPLSWNPHVCPLEYGFLGPQMPHFSLIPNWGTSAKHSWANLPLGTEETAQGLAQTLSRGTVTAQPMQNARAHPKWQLGHQLLSWY